MLTCTSFLCAERDAQSSLHDYHPSTTLNEKVSLWLGDITRLEIDAVVNAAVGSLIDSAIGPRRSVRTALHKAAGPMLKNEIKLGSFPVGEAKVSFGYNLPAKCELYNIIILHRNFPHMYDIVLCIHMYNTRGM